ncbi:hypothetical protein AWC02_05195 [Mycolicibacter engbaekii]|uniref:DNA primase/polymerase bifunctional N-terminal domain-containing protein n=1 Tax=Mycolicibacter engbaekii TaxID=188915 RepID=A0A1X1TZH0_9MYCO|nr:bifunctional DNA primase/polymerase [Mycolicibacter engbaekii]ORV49982.1 hypothetical protein AWC02_05195 [Mycolicibacter engbaekii]
MTRRDRLPLLDEAALAVEVKATTAESDKKSAAASHDAELSRVRVERGVVVPGDEETPGRTGGTSDGDSLTTKQTVAPDHTGGSGGFDGLAANADLDFVLGTAALDYARRGWEVHPLRRGDKIPATPHGVLDATSVGLGSRKYWSTWARYSRSPGPLANGSAVAEGAAATQRLPIASRTETPVPRRSRCRHPVRAVGRAQVNPSISDPETTVLLPFFFNFALLAQPRWADCMSLTEVSLPSAVRVPSWGQG